MADIYSNINDFFNKYITVDVELLKRIRQFRMEWAVKRIDSKTSNLDFLSGMTLGVQRVRFSSMDENKLFREVLRIDGDLMQKDLYRVKGINKEWKVTRNATYHLMLFIIKEILVKKLDPMFIKEVYFIVAYKMITSMMSRRFENFTLDPRIANLVVEKMSNKFILKQLGSWQKYFDYRSSFFAPDTDLANKLTSRYEVKLANDTVSYISGTIKSTVNRVYSIIVEIYNSDSRIDSNTLTKLENEEMVLADLKNSHSRYASIALSRVNSLDFVNDNYIYLLSEVSTNLNTVIFKTMLSNISKLGLESIDDTKDIVDDIIKYSVAYLTRIDKIHHVDTNIMSVLRILRAYYGSSKIRENEVVNLKKRTMEIVLDNIDVKTSWILTTLNLNLILYIVLIALIKGK